MTKNALNLPFRVMICGLDELKNHSGARVSHVLSILDPDWPAPEIFGTFHEHAKLELRFDDVIEARTGVIPPAAADVENLLAFGRLLDHETSAHLLVHCHAGVSRSSASLALLLAQALPEVSGAAIFAEILRIRPQIWPNLRIIEIGDALLGRNGELISAVATVYGKQIAADPALAAEFRAGGRGREVALGLAARNAET